MLLWGGSFQKFTLTKRKDALMKNLQKNVKWQTNESLRMRHFHLNCQHVIWVMISNIQQYRWWCMSPCRWLEIKHWNVARQKPLIFRIVTLNKHPHKPFCSCCCLLLVQILVLKHPDASISEPSSPLSWHWNSHGPLLRPDSSS